MVSLYYQNLNVSRPDVIQNRARNGLKVFNDYLRVTREHLNTQVLSVTWKNGRKPENHNDLEEPGVWVEISGISNELSESDYRILFDDNLKEIYEQDNISDRQKLKYYNDNKINIIERDRDSEQFFVDRLPNKEQLVIRPNTYTVQKQREAVLNLRERPSDLHRPLLKLFEDNKNRFVNWEIPNIINSDIKWNFLTDSNRQGTGEQRDFVIKALSTPDFALLEGPPGSGKTTAICELITQSILEGKKILLCASTHVAIDNVVERILEKSEEAKNVIPVRIGDNWNVSESVRQYTLNNFKKEERKRIRKHINNKTKKSPIQKEWLSIINDQDNNTIETMILESANLVCGTTIGILQHPEIKNRKNINEPIFDMLIIDEASKTTFQEFLVPALLAKRWVLVGDPLQLSPYVDSEELGANLAKIIAEDERNAAIDLYYSSLKGNQYRSTVVQCTDVQKQEMFELYSELSDDDKFITKEADVNLELADIAILTEEEIEKNIDRLPLDIGTARFVKNQDVIDRIIGWNSRNKDLEPKWEDQIAWRILSLNEQRFNADSEGAGKLRRSIEKLIPHKLKEKLKKDIEGLTRIALPSVLECLQSGISRDRKPDGTEHGGSFLTDGLPDDVLETRHTLLSYQHRMSPGISEFPRLYIYNGKALHDSEHVKNERDFNYPEYTHRSEWLNITKGYRRKGNSNPVEAEIIIEEIKGLASWHENTKPLNMSVAVLTFYIGQERELRYKMRKLTGQRNNFSHFNYKNLVIDLCTVDRFQGHEADVVFLSFANNRSTYFLESPNRLNVAITRARYQLVNVGNWSGLHESSNDSRLKEYCKYHENKKSYRIG